MLWSPQQDRALVKVARWLESDQQVFRLFGYAGTGKTTLAKHFAEGVSGTVLFGAYTGKAAYVLRQKGCAGATTVHSHIYNSKDKGRARLKELEAELAEVLMELGVELQNDTPERRQYYIDSNVAVKNLREKIEAEKNALAQPMFTLNPESAVADAALTVIDEVSMVDGRMGQDLLSFGTKVLVLGDPAQLPPVHGTGFFTEQEPDFMLDEIHRQARDNPIIAMATDVRNEKSLKLGTYGESRVIEQAHLSPEEAMEADQILVGRNKTRYATNRRVRSLLGHEELLPIHDDRIVCLRNNHDLGLLNGAIWHVDDVGQSDEELIYMTIRSDDGGTPIEVEAHTHYFLGNEDKLGWWERKNAEEFDYGYALTGHKAQGSQWPYVMAFDESWCFRKDRWKWLYTVLTRAAERITVVRM